MFFQSARVFACAPLASELLILDILVLWLSVLYRVCETLNIVDKKNKAKEFEKFSMKYHLQMWQPREFLFRKVFMQYLHTTISALGLL